MKTIRELFQALSGGGFKGIEQQALAKFVGQNLNVYKPADQSVTSSTTFTDDDTLAVTLPLGNHKFEFDIPTTMAAAGGIKVSLVARDGLSIANIAGSAIFLISGASPAVITISALSADANGGTSSAWTRVQIVGSVEVTNPGTLQLQFTQSASNGTATKTLRGATLVTRLITTA